MTTWLKHNNKHNDSKNINHGSDVTILEPYYKINKLVDLTVQHT